MDLGKIKAADKIRGMSVASATLVVQFLVSVAFQLMGSFMPLFFEKEFSMSLIEATSWTGTAALYASSIMAVTAPFWGYMCDKVGIKKILLFVIGGNIIVYSGMALSTNVVHIVILRALQGCFGGISTVMFALVASAVPASDLRKALSYQMAAQTMGGLISPGIGGLLASFLGYRLTFASSAFLFVCILPLVSIMSIPSEASTDKSPVIFSGKEYVSLLPDFIALIMIYSCISFIMPTISWFLNTLGVPDNQLLIWTAAATILNGLAFAIATPLVTRIVSERSLPLLSLIASALIFSTAFVFNPLHFLILRILIGAVQAGIPPNLLGGKSGRKGAGMGFLNSARFLGMAFGPYLATTILADGVPPRPLYMFTTMSIISLIAAIFIYFTKSKKKADEF